MRFTQNRIFQHAFESDKALSEVRATVLSEGSMWFHSFYITLICVGTDCTNFSSFVRDARQKAAMYCVCIEVPILNFGWEFHCWDSTPIRIYSLLFRIHHKMSYWSNITCKSHSLKKKFKKDVSMKRKNNIKECLIRELCLCFNFSFPASFFGYRSVVAVHLLSVIFWLFLLH